MALIEMSDFAQAAWRLKFDRANLLLSEFGTELKGYLSNNPTETVIEDWDGTTLKVRLRIRVQSDPKWSVLIGDIIHNFRSSLDSLLFSIIAYKASEVGETLSKELQRTIAFPFRTRANQMKSVPGLFRVAREPCRSGW